MIKRELGIFLVVGTLTVLVDFLSYQGLLALSGWGNDTAKAIGFLVGTLFAYVANRFWTFGHQTHAGSSVWRFGLLYAATLGANVATNALMLQALGPRAGAVQLAFLVATGVSAVMNFLGMKFYVFNARAALEHP